MAKRRTRQEKYPETSTFHYFNANPKNRITGDCWARAISTALELPYTQVVMEMAEMQCKTGWDAEKLIDKYVKSKGWIKHRQPHHCDGTKFTGKEFCREIRTDCWEFDDDYFDSRRILANIGTHHIVAIVDTKVYDIWDSTNGKIGNFWTKGEGTV